MRATQLARAFFFVLAAVAAPALAVTYQFSTPIAGESVPVTLQLSDVPGGDAVDVTVSIPAGEGDLLGLFGNVATESIVSSMAVADADDVVSQWQFKTNQVWKVGGGNTVSPVKKWDWGLRFAEQGCGTSGPITSASFRLTGTGLSVAELTGAANQGWVLGVRIQDTSGPEGSAKIGMPVGTLPYPEPPTIEITSPADGALLASSSVAVSGAATESPTSVEVNGVAAALSSGAFSVVLTLADGLHTLTATATNAAGSASDSVSVTVDTTPPAVTITSPPDGMLTTAGAIVVTGTVADASPIASFTLNGQPVALSGGEFSTPVALGLGSNSLTATAVDAAGHSGSASVVVTRGEPPAIAITTPANGLLTNQTPLTVSGTVTGSGPIAVAVNGVAATVTGTSFTAAVPLSEGANTITAGATSAFGAASAAVSVTLDTTPPVVVFAAPANGAQLSQTPTVAIGTVQDASPIVAVTLNGSALAPGNAFNASVPLVEGANTLTAFATDAAGNTGSASVTVSLATGPALALAITTPLDGEILVRAEVDVAGTISDARALVRVNGVAATVVGTQYVARRVPVGEGPNTLAATATRGTDTASAAVDVFYNAPPAVIIRSPAAGSEHRTATIDVEGTVDDPAAFVDVNGVVAAVESAGRFLARGVPLADGANTLTARAIDAYGAQGEDAVDVTRNDGAAPHLRVLSTYGVPWVVGIPTAFSDLDEYDRALAVGDPLGQAALPLNPVSRDHFAPQVDIPIVSESDYAVLADAPDAVLFETFLDGGALPFSSELLSLQPFEQFPQEPASFVASDAFEPETFRPTHFSEAFLPGCVVDAGCPPDFLDHPATVTIRASASGRQDDLLLVVAPRDFTARQVAITSPEPGSTIAGSTVTVSGTVDSALPLLDIARYRVFDELGATIGSGTVPLLVAEAPADPTFPVKGRFTIPGVFLGTGLHTIEVAAWNAAGHQATTDTFVNVGPNAPGVSLVSPADGSATASATATVTLNFAADATLDAVNGMPDGRSFAAGVAPDVLTLPLALGANTLRIDYTTAAGSFTETFTIHRVAQAAAPRIVTPADGSFYNSETIPVRGTVEYGTPYVEVNGVPGVIAADGVSFTATIPAPRETGAIAINANGVVLRPYPVTATAYPLGGSTTIEITPDFEAFPIAVAPPDGTATVDDTVIVAGRVLEPMRLTLTTPTQSFTADAQTSFAFEFPAADLAVGANALSVRGVDRASNARVESLTITRATSALSLVSPAAGSSLPGLAVDLNLTAAADLSLEAVFAHGRLVSGIASPSVPFPVSAGPVTLTNLPLEPGPNDLRIIYRRAGGPQEVLALQLVSTATAQAFVTGRVLDGATGAPVVGASVSIDVSGYAQSGFTNEGGIYLLAAVPGSLVGSIQATGYGGAALFGSVSFGQTTQIADVALVPTGPPVAVGTEESTPFPIPAILGHVIDNATGAPIAGASVVVEVAGQTQSGFTDAQGVYYFETPTGALTGSIQAAGYNGATLSGSIPAGQLMYMQDALLTSVGPPVVAGSTGTVASASLVTGRVLDAQTNTPISGATVSVESAGQTRSGLTNNQGIYLLEALPGALTGSIQAAGYSGATLSGTAGAGLTLMSDALLTASGPPVAVVSTGAVPSAAVLLGSVTDAQTGAAIGGALVTLVVNGQTITGVADAQGAFRFEVPPGEVTGTIVATGYGSTPFNVTVAAGETLNVNIASSPPELHPTGLPALMNEVDILVPPPGTVTDWEKVTVVGTVLRPSSAVTVNGVPATVIGSRFTAKHIDLAMGANTLTATATNVGSPPAAKSIAVERATTPVLKVTIYSPPEGATVPGSGLVIRGFVSAKDAPTNVAGEYAALDEGVFDVLDVPVSTEDTEIAVLAATRDGTQEASDRSGIVVASDQRALILYATPASGVAPFSTTLEAFRGGPSFPIARRDFDTDGDGDLDVVGATAPQATATFPSARLARPRVFETTNEGVEVSASTGVNSHLAPVIHRQFAQGNPVDLAPGPSGGLYVLDGASATITLFDRAGALVSAFGSSGAGSGQMSSPQGLAAANNGDIYVADTGNDRIQVFSEAGAHLRTLGSSGSALGEFDAPRAVAIDDDRLIVSDAGNNRLQILNLDGSPTEVPEFSVSTPRGLDQGGGLGVLVSSPSRGFFGFGGDALRPIEFASTTAAADRPTAPVDSALGSDGLWVAEADEQALLLYDEDLTFRQRLAVGTSTLAVLESPRRDAHAVFVADGVRVTELSAALPSPTPIVVALRDLLANNQISEALQLIHPLQRDTFRGLYADVEGSLPSHAALMSNFRVDLLRPDSAIVRFNAPSTANGQPVMKSFPVYLTREEDGSWSILDY